jgi:hypothetical protein
VPRLLEDSRSRAFLDDASRVHHRDPVGDRRDDGEIVRDVDDRDAELVLQARDLREQVRLRDDIEPGRPARPSRRPEACRRAP